MKDAVDEQLLGLQIVHNDTRIRTNKMESAKETKPDHICFDFEEADDESKMSLRSLVLKELEMRMTLTNYKRLIQSNPPLGDLVEVSGSSYLAMVMSFPFLTNRFPLSLCRNLKN